MSRMHDQGAADGGAARRTPPTERGPIRKSRVALDAMARAALRSRTPANPTVRSPRVPAAPGRGQASTGTRQVADAVNGSSQSLGSVPNSRTTARLRLLSLAALTALLLVLATLVAVWASGIGSPGPGASGGRVPPLRTTTPTTPPTTPRVRTTPPSTVAPSVPVTQAPAPTSTTTAPATASNGLPQLSALTPLQGGTGQVVTLSGVNLFSPDGYVDVTFGGQAAPTSCATQSICTVTVPTIPGGPASIPVSLTTAAGTSNALPFQYQPS
jgi:hypothetical protein